MRIIENFLPLSLQNEIFKVFTDNNIYWQFLDFTSLPSTSPSFRTYKNVKDTFQLTHPIRNLEAVYSPHYHLVFPIAVLAEKELGINLTNICRIKCNLLTPDTNSSANFYHYPHQDVVTSESNYRSLIYYINDSDGDTVIFKEKNIDTDQLTEAMRVTPKKGRAVIFDSTQLHCSTSPKLTNKRLVLNFLFKI